MDVLNHLREEDNEIVAFDIETNSTDEKNCTIIGIAVTCYEDEGMYIPLYEYNGTELVPFWAKELEEATIVRDLCDILINKKLIMHNGVFDIACIFHSFGINLTDALYCDTILLKHTLDEERPFGLKDLGQKYFGDEAVSEQLDLKANVTSKGGKWNMRNKDMYMADLDILGKYACKDVILTLKAI